MKSGKKNTELSSSMSVVNNTFAFVLSHNNGRTHNKRSTRTYPHNIWIIMWRRRGIITQGSQALLRRTWGSSNRQRGLLYPNSKVSFSSTTTSTSTTPPEVTIVEVGPRDGLQNEKTTPLTIDQRVELINLLVKAGCPRIEVGSFVSPKWVPAMADSDQVYQQVVAKQRQQQLEHSTSSNNATTIFSCLVPNARGMQQALQVKVDEIAIFAAASETFSQKVSSQAVDAFVGAPWDSIRFFSKLPR